MAATTFAAYGLYPHGTGLREVLQTLSQKGIDKESICMMLPAEHPIAATVREASAGAIEKSKDKDDEAAGLIRWLSQLGAVLIPTFGFFIHSPEFFRALITEDDSTAQCGGSGSLRALGFPEDTAQRYGNKLGDRGVLLYLSCAEDAQTGALELLRGTGAQETGRLNSHAHFVATA